MTKADKLIFAVLIAFSVFSILFVNVFFSVGADKYVIIETNGREYAKYKIGEEKSVKPIEIKTNFGYNKIEVYSDYVKMADSDCRDKSCVHAKAISSGGMIVCLPNKCVVRIESERSVDGVSY